MVRRENFVNKIRALEYGFKAEKKRVTIWRKKGSTAFISLPKTDLLEDEYVISTLRQAGESEADIRAFIANYSVPPKTK